MEQKSRELFARVHHALVDTNPTEWRRKRNRVDKLFLSKPAFLNLHSQFPKSFYQFPNWLTATQSRCPMPSPPLKLIHQQIQKISFLTVEARSRACPARWLLSQAGAGPRTTSAETWSATSSEGSTLVLDPQLSRSPRLSHLRG